MKNKKRFPLIHNLEINIPLDNFKNETKPLIETFPQNIADTSQKGDAGWLNQFWNFSVAMLATGFFSKAGEDIYITLKSKLINVLKNIKKSVKRKKITEPKEYPYLILNRKIKKCKFYIIFELRYIFPKDIDLGFSAIESFETHLKKILNHLEKVFVSSDIGIHLIWDRKNKKWVVLEIVDINSDTVTIFPYDPAS